GVEPGNLVGPGCLDLHDRETAAVADAGAEAPTVEGIDQRVVRALARDHLETAVCRVGVLAQTNRVPEVVGAARDDRDHVAGGDVPLLHDVERPVGTDLTGDAASGASNVGAVVR